MSYMQFQQQCEDCGNHWNAAFGIVGTTQIAAPPAKCPHCGSVNLKKIADNWEWEPQPAPTVVMRAPVSYTLRNEDGVAPATSPESADDTLAEAKDGKQV